MRMEIFPAEKDEALPEFTEIVARRMMQPGTPQRIVVRANTFRFFLVNGEIEFFLPESRDPVRIGRHCVLMLRPEEEALCSSNAPKPVPYLRLELSVRPPEPERLPPRLAILHYAHPLFSVADRLEELLNGPAEPDAALLAGLLAQEFWCYLRRRNPLDNPGDPRLARMLRYLDEKMLEHPTRTQLAREFNLSPQQVNLLFRRGIGISPGEYVRRRLVRAARELLHAEQLSVKETAVRLGFSNPFYFSRVFKQITGCAPSKD